MNYGTMYSSKPNANVVLETIEKLKAKGHEVVKIDFKEMEFVTETFINLAGLNHITREQLAMGEEIIPEFKITAFMVKLPMFIRWMVSLLYKYFINPRMGLMIKYSLNSDLESHYEMINKFVQC
jgi:hypothetical protein